jgi:pimeloyl-ACP methyl ester carboxylesterase
MIPIGTKLKLPTNKIILFNWLLIFSLAFLFSLLGINANAETPESVIDIPTRPGITQRMLVIEPAISPKAAVVLFAGGNGRLGLFPNGTMARGDSNFLVRSRRLFESQGLLVVVVDAPSDRQTTPYLAGFRETASHVEDIKAIIKWIRSTKNIPIWLIGTSRGTQSVAHAATQLNRVDGPDGIVLTSSILVDKTPNVSVPNMDLLKINVPTLVVHHELDGCRLCLFSDINLLMSKLPSNHKNELIKISGGQTQGDPCNALGYHGYNGVETPTIEKIAAWIKTH